jgi:hypothetical protein
LKWLDLPLNLRFNFSQLLLNKLLVVHELLEQIAVMIAHPAFEREFELWKFAPQFSPCYLGQLPGLVLAGDDDSYH